MAGDLTVVMAGRVPAIHDFLLSQDVDARDKRGHDDGELGADRQSAGVAHWAISP
jgi:hypothetical protein